MDPSTAALAILCEHGFHGSRILAEGEITALVYARWWASGLVDVVIVNDEHDASTYRARTDLHDLSQTVVAWRRAGTVRDVTAAVLALPSAGVPLAQPPTTGPRRARCAGPLLRW